MRPGIKPASSWILVRLVTLEPQRELQENFFNELQQHLVATEYPCNIPKKVDIVITVGVACIVNIIILQMKK